MTNDLKKLRFFVPGQNSTDRDAGLAVAELNMAEAQELGAVPAAATILASMVREGLERTEQPDFIGALLADSPRQNEPNESYVMRRFTQVERHFESARAHAQNMYENCLHFAKSGSGETKDPALEAFALWWNRNGLRLTEAASIEAAEDYAGLADMIVEHPEYGECILDIRVQTTPDEKFQFYVGMGMDLAAKASARGANSGKSIRIISVLFSHNAPGLFAAKTWTLKEQATMTRAFVALKTLWYLESGLKPAAEKKAQAA